MEDPELEALSTFNITGCAEEALGLLQGVSVHTAGEVKDRFVVPPRDDGKGVVPLLSPKNTVSELSIHIPSLSLPCKARLCYKESGHP